MPSRLDLMHRCPGPRSYQGYFPCTEDFHFPGHVLYFSCSSTNTIIPLFKYNTYIGQHKGWTRKKPTRILSMKISRPSNFATASSQEPHPFAAVSVSPMNKAGLVCFKKDKDQMRSQIFGKRLLGIPSYSFSRNWQCNLEAFQDEIRHLLNFACKSYSWSVANKMTH